MFQRYKYRGINKFKINHFFIIYERFRESLYFFTFCILQSISVTSLS